MIELEHHECTVMLGCTYDVFVQTTDGMFRQNVTYTVPGKYGKLLWRLLLYLTVQFIHTACLYFRPYYMERLMLNVELPLYVEFITS